MAVTNLVTQFAAAAIGNVDGFVVPVFGEHSTTPGVDGALQGRFVPVVFNRI